jgi:hypothetical protein
MKDRTSFMGKKQLRIDLTAHGPIGFQPYWLRIQGYGGRNLLEQFADACIRGGIDICAVVSQAENMSEPYQDRFDMLVQSMKSISPRYHVEKPSPNLLVVDVPGQGPDSPVYLVNAQSVVVQEADGTKLSHLVVGTNKIPNLLPLEETIARCEAENCIQIAEHPFKRGNPSGIGRDLFMKHKGTYDAIDLDPQLAFYTWMGSLPSIGPTLADYTRGINDKARELALDTRKPLIAGSNAHRFEDIGLSYIIVPRSQLHLASGEELVQSLRKAIRHRHFNHYLHYESLPGLIGWTRQFKKGLARKSDE